MHFLSFVNSSSFHYKCHNQNKADSTVKKRRLHCLLEVEFMSKEHFMFQWCLVCLVSFLVAMRILSGLYHAWLFGDKYSAFNCCKKDQNNTRKFSGRLSFEAVKPLSALSMIHLKTYSRQFCCACISHIPR